MKKLSLGKSVFRSTQIFIYDEIRDLTGALVWDLVYFPTAHFVMGSIWYSVCSETEELILKNVRKTMSGEED
jgi:hypothetical protein